jgi:hypothetical protein
MTELSIEPFANADLDGLVALVDAEGWSEYAVDVERTSRALSVPGVTTLVAIGDGRVVGATGVQSDGVIQAHVSCSWSTRIGEDASSASGSCARDSSVQEACGSICAPGQRVATSGLARAALSAFASRASTLGSEPAILLGRGEACRRLAFVD